MKLVDIDLAYQWRLYLNATFNPGMEVFKTRLRGMVTDPDEVDTQVTVCNNCRTPLLRANGHEHGRGGGRPMVCNTCWPGFAECGSCHRFSPADGGLYPTVAAYDYKVCRECIVNTRAWYRCDICMAYYRRVDGHDAHPDGECCVSPAKEFTFPYNGDVISQDQRVEVRLGAPDEVTDQGMVAIRSYIQRYARTLGSVYERDSRAWKMYVFANNFDIGKETKTKEGTFATRLKKQAYKTYQLKLDPEVLTQVGNLMSQHGGKDEVFYVEVTRNLNLPREQFCNDGSCYWSQYKASRCSLKTNGGIGLRTFGGTGKRGGSRECIGRLWIFPMKVDVDGRLVPTFATDTGIWFAFNSYGNIQELIGMRVLCAMVGQDHYVKARITGTGSEKAMYINSEVGYLVGPPDVVDKYQHSHLALTPPVHSNLYETEKEQSHA